MTIAGRCSWLLGTWVSARTAQSKGDSRSPPKPARRSTPHTFVRCSSLPAVPPLPVTAPRTLPAMLGSSSRSIPRARAASELMSDSGVEACSSASVSPTSPTFREERRTLPASNVAPLGIATPTLLLLLARSPSPCSPSSPKTRRAFSSNSAADFEFRIFCDEDADEEARTCSG